MRERGRKKEASASSSLDNYYNAYMRHEQLFSNARLKWKVSIHYVRDARSLRKQLSSSAQQTAGISNNLLVFLPRPNVCIFVFAFCATKVAGKRRCFRFVGGNVPSQLCIIAARTDSRLPRMTLS